MAKGDLKTWKNPPRIFSADYIRKSDGTVNTGTLQVPSSTEQTTYGFKAIKGRIYFTMEHILFSATNHKFVINES